MSRMPDGTAARYLRAGGAGADPAYAQPAFTEVSGEISDAQHGSRTVANAHAHSHLSGIGANDHHNRSHDHSLADDGSPIAEAGVPNHMSKNKLAWTADKILKGAGIGADPIEIDVPGGVPSGLIAIWHGTLASIPSGWVLCDGNNSTPNLLARFIEWVATAVTDPGATGGGKSKTTAGHQHDAPLSNYSTDNLNINPGGIWGTGAAISTGQVATINSISRNEAAHKVKSNTDSISDIRPAYYDVAFIMKT